MKDNEYVALTEEGFHETAAALDFLDESEREMMLAVTMSAVLI